MNDIFDFLCCRRATATQEVVSENKRLKRELTEKANALIVQAFSTKNVAVTEAMSDRPPMLRSRSSSWGVARRDLLRPAQITLGRKLGAGFFAAVYLCASSPSCLCPCIAI